MHEHLRQDPAATEIEATAGGGMVTVATNGLKQVLAITIDPESFPKDDVESLQDLIVAAVNDGQRKVDEPSARRWAR